MGPKRIRRVPVASHPSDAHVSSEGRLGIPEEPGQVVRAVEPAEPAVLGRPREALPSLPGEAFLAFDHDVQLEPGRGHGSSARVTRFESGARGQPSDGWTHSPGRTARVAASASRATASGSRAQAAGFGAS